MRHLPHLGEAQPDSFRRESDSDIEIRFAAGPDAVDDIDNGPAPSRQIAAEFIFPAVDLRAEKLAENIAVRAMHLDAIEAGGLGPLGGQDEILHQRPDLELNDNLSAKNVPGWDSFNHVNLIINIEEEFGVQFTNDEVGGMQNVGSLKTLLASKIT